MELEMNLIIAIYKRWKEGAIYTDSMILIYIKGSTNRFSETVSLSLQNNILVTLMKWKK